MRVHGAAAVPVRAGPGAAAERLVVLVAVVAEGEVVHRALARRGRAERAEQRGRHRLRGLHVAGRHGGGARGRQHASRRDDDVDGLQAAVVERDVRVDQRAEDVEHRRRRHRLGRVEVVAALRRGAGEVDGGPAGARGRWPRHTTIRAAVVELLAEAPRRVRRAGEPVEHAAHGLRGVVLHVAHVGGAPRGGRTPPTMRPSSATPRALAATWARRSARFCCRSRTGWAAPVSSSATSRFSQPAVLDQQEVLDQDALLVDGAAARRHRAGRHPADVGVVGARGDEEERARSRPRRRRAAGGRAAPGTPA